MNKFVCPAILGLATSHLSIASIQADQFQATGFTKNNVFGSWLQVFDASTKSFKAHPSSKDLGEFAIDALSQVKPSKTKQVDYSYILTLLTGSSFESQELLIYIDTSGNGCFQHGKKPVVYFYSSELAREIEKATKKTE